MVVWYLCSIVEMNILALQFTIGYMSCAAGKPIKAQYKEINEDSEKAKLLQVSVPQGL